MDVLFAGILYACDYTGDCTPEYTGFLRAATATWHLIFIELTEWMIYYGGMDAEDAEKWKTWVFF